MDDVSVSSLYIVIWFIYLFIYIKSILCLGICLMSLKIWGWMIHIQLTYEGNMFDDTQSYVNNFSQHGKEIYFVPYVVG